MNPEPRYFLLVMGEPDATPQKYWTKEEIFSYLAKHSNAAENSQCLAITSDSGQQIYSKDEILAIVSMRKAQKIYLPIYLVLFLGAVFFPRPWSAYSFWGCVVAFVPFWFITARGVTAGNLSFIKRLMRK